MTDALLGTGGLVFMGLYLFSLIGVGLLGRAARKEDSLADFYLSGRSLGLFVLLMTLYATQYSGNTLVGFTAKAYRQGFQFLVSVTFMMAVIGAYLLYAPKLYRISRKRKYITPGDFIQDRFGSRFLTVVTTILFIVALGNYVLSNLKAIGYIVFESSGGRISFAQGIIALSLIMVIYETLGGMRSVAWTDVIQGVLLLIGCVFIFFTIEHLYGGLSGAAGTLMSGKFWTPPTTQQKVSWMSTLVLISLGISIYPHAIQRIFAAKSEIALKRSFQVMVFMPIVTTFFMIVVGIVGAAQFPNLDKQASEKITLKLLNEIARQLPAVSFMLVVFLSAAVAAIMSTVDSALLSISCLFTQDIYRPARPDAEQSHLTLVGKRFSWLVMALMAFLAIVLPQTIWRLIVIKLELLCQVAPAIVLGIHFRSLRTSAVTAGLLAGTFLTLGLMFANIYDAELVAKKPLGIHAGLWGLAANLIVLAIVTALQPAQQQEAVDGAVAE